MGFPERLDGVLDLCEQKIALPNRAARKAAQRVSE